MGIRNQQRRAAKKKARDERRRRHDATTGDFPTGLFDGPFGATPEERVEDLLRQAAFEFDRGRADRAQAHLSRLADTDEKLVDRVVAEVFANIVDGLWNGGWLPADVIRIVRRRQGKRPASLALEQVAAQLRGYAPTTVDRRWHDQLRELGASVWQEHADHRLTAWGNRQKLDRPAVLGEAVRLLGLFATLPVLEVITALPGAADSGRAATATGAIDERMLGRVRGLLAKAESTEFPEEAEALSAKAQELMARHSIDQALLAATRQTATGGTTARPGAVRIGVDAPYESAKALLLQEVAQANGCHSVWSNSLGFATVIGFPSDTGSVELLYTSLLVQATAAMVHSGPQRGYAGQSTTRSFRQSFLQAYAARIGQRLRSTSDEVSREMAATEGADRLLPVLAAREDVVRERVEEMFPEVVHRSVSGTTNRAGWAAGTAAADLATLGARAEVAGS